MPVEQPVIRTVRGVMPGTLPTPAMAGSEDADAAGADRRGGLRRDRRGDRAAPARDHRRRDPRQGAGPGRDVVAQPLPGRGGRRPEPLLLVLVRPAARLAAAVP